jgi:hypothetical protein
MLLHPVFDETRNVAEPCIHTTNYMAIRGADCFLSYRLQVSTFCGSGTFTLRG